MTEIKNTKITADITSNSDKEQVEYVTFWGQLKGNLEKQTDLSNVLSVIKRSINDLSTKYLRKQDKLTPGDNIVIEKNSEDDLVISGPTHTSQLINDGEGAQDSEGSPDKFTLRSEVSNIADILNAKVEDVEFELNNKIYDLNSEINTKQDKLTPGKNITIEENSEGDLVIDGPTHTSQLVNDGNGDTSSEGLFIPYVTLPEVGDALVPVNNRIDTVETNIADIESLLDSKQDNLTAGEGIKLEDNVISVKHGTTPNDGILTIKQNDKPIGTFSANQSENKDINIKVNSLPDMEVGFDGKVLGVENQVWKMIDLPSEVLLVTMTLTSGEPTLDVDFSDISKAISAGKVVIVKVDTTGEYMYLSKSRSYTEDNVGKLEFTFSNLEFNSSSDSLIADYIVLIIGYNNSTSSTYSSFTRVPLTIAKR